MKFNVLAGSILVLASAACATSDFDRLYEAGHYPEAVRTFEADSSLHVGERELFRVGLLHALPKQPTYDPARALQLFERLLLLHPESPDREEATRLMLLVAEIVNATEQASRQALELEREMATVVRETERLERQVAWFETVLERHDGDRDLLYEMVSRLEDDLRRKDSEFAALQEELDRLKAVDLRTLRGGEGGGAAGAPDTVRAPPDSLDGRIPPRR